jgi:hypothetical protein
VLQNLAGLHTRKADRHLWPGAPLPGEAGFAAALRAASDSEHDGSSGMACAAASAAAGGLDPAWYGSPYEECVGPMDGSEAALHAAWPLGALAPWGVPQAAAPLGPLEGAAAAAAASEVAASNMDGTTLRPFELAALQSQVTAATEAEGLSLEVEALEAGICTKAVRLPAPTTVAGSQLNLGSDDHRMLLSYGVPAARVQPAVGRRAVFVSAREADTASASAALLAYTHAAAGSDGDTASEAALSDLFTIPPPQADAQLRVVAVEGSDDAAAAEWQECQQGQEQEATHVELAAAMISAILEAPSEAAAADRHESARGYLASQTQWPEEFVDELIAAARGADDEAHAHGCDSSWA